LHCIMIESVLCSKFVQRNALVTNVTRVERLELI